MPKPSSDNSIPSARDLDPSRSYILKENSRKQRQSCNFSIRSTPNIPKKPVKQIILNTKLSEKIMNTTFGLRISSIPAADLSPMSSLNTDSDLKTATRNEITTFPSIYISNNDIQKQRSVSVPKMKPNYQPVKPVRSEPFSDIYHTCRDKAKLYKNILKTAAPGLLLSGYQLDSTQRSIERCSVDLTAIPKNELIREKSCENIREKRIKHLHLSSERHPVKPDEMEGLENFKYRAKKRSEKITIDQLQVKPGSESKFINISTLIQRFTNSQRKL